MSELATKYRATVTRRQSAPAVPPDLKERLLQLQQHQQTQATEPNSAEPVTVAEPEPPSAPPAPPPDKKRGPHDLQLDFLNANLGRPVTLFLMTGIRLIGELRRFDQFTLLLENSDGTMQLVFKHALSTIQPGTGMRRPDKAA